ncbi:MAG: dihydropteroate synthase [bacterium]
MSNDEEPLLRKLATARGPLSLADRPLLVGILNLTPDSFSDGGRFSGPEEAVDAALEMVELGADVIDVGGESTRPGATAVDEDEELARILPVVRELGQQANLLFSIDTVRAAVARQALDCGAAIVNDVSACRWDGDMFSLVAKAGAGLVLMHSPGRPEVMMELANYGQVVTEVSDFLDERCRLAVEAGVAANALIVDPGLGFGKQLDDNLELAANFKKHWQGDQPVMLGPSRKRWLGEVCDIERASERDTATAAAAALAAFSGVELIRTHDPGSTLQAVKLGAALRRHRGT